MNDTSRLPYCIELLDMIANRNNIPKSGTGSFRCYVTNHGQWIVGQVMHDQQTIPVFSEDCGEDMARHLTWILSPIDFKALYDRAVK